jgi:hypothetical protein
MAAMRDMLRSRLWVELGIVIVAAFFIGILRPIPEIELREIDAFIRIIGWQTWGHLPHWQPYVETGQPLSLLVDPVAALPLLIFDYNIAVSVSSVLATILAGVGGWLLLRLVRMHPLACAAFGIACAAVFERDYSIIWAAVGVIGAFIGGIDRRRAMIVLAAVAAAIWLASGGSALAAANPVVYAALIGIVLVALMYGRRRSTSWLTVVMIVTVGTVGVFSVAAIQRWLSENARRGAPIATLSNLLLSCLDYLQETEQDSVPFLSVAVPNDPRLALDYLKRGIRRVSAANIELQAEYAIALDRNSAIELRARGYTELKRSPRLSPSTSDSHHCLYMDIHTPSYAFLIPLGNSRPLIPLTPLVHVLDQIVLRVAANPTQTYRVVISERAEAGWQVWIDGKAAEVEAFNGLISVAVAQGNGVREIVFRYRMPHTTLAATWLIAGSILGVLYLLRADRLLPPSLRKDIIAVPIRLFRRLWGVIKRVYAVLATPISGDAEDD